MAGAHAVHNGMSLVKETHSVLHGTKVSYGILVQLLAEGKREEVEKLVPFYKDNNLAYNLACVNVTEDVEEKNEKKLQNLQLVKKKHLNLQLMFVHQKLYLSNERIRRINKIIK